jgi:hypothetical protein
VPEHDTGSNGDSPAAEPGIGRGDHTKGWLEQTRFWQGHRGSLKGSSLPNMRTEGMALSVMTLKVRSRL